MQQGYLRVVCRTNNNLNPVEDALVIIKDTDNNILYEQKTNNLGQTDIFSLNAKDKTLSLDENNKEIPYSLYNVEVFKTGYKDNYIYNVQIFEEISSTLPVMMQPLIEEEKNIKSDFNILRTIIPINNDLTQIDNNIRNIDPKGFQKVFIPNYITVHLGSPNSNSKNVKVSFIDYIKNVASSEIYPTWEKSALYANIYAQISFTLNRIFTLWYRSRGYNFDITNSTAYDQYFVYGRNIYDNISDIIDQIFNEYIIREGRLEPYFAQYCNGTTSKCDGLSQWGSQDLAKRGYSPISILKYYYPNDILITETNNFSSNVDSYPGYLLKYGMTDKNIEIMQNYLNRIRINYPLIPQINPVSGYFGNQTLNAVKVFQNISGLKNDGIIGKKTWYMITKYYVAIKRLAELDSEGEIIDVGVKPKTSIIKLNDQGEDVVVLQFLLNYIAEYYPNLKQVINDSYFGLDTKNAVIEFQKYFNLTPDGIVGPNTWNYLYKVYNSLKNQGGNNINKPNYPGYNISIGSRGAYVLLIQNYLNMLSLPYPSIKRVIVDGIYGNNTYNSVISFQKLFNLKQDGIIGINTWNKLVDEFYNFIT